jgi:hypothetical protein
MKELQTMASTLEEIHWRISQLHHCRWEDNNDPSQESAPTYAAFTKYKSLLETLAPLLMSWCPQDISDLKIIDKTYGSISLQWYGPVFELDLDIEADGKVNLLLCRTGSDRDTWISAEDVTLERVVRALMQVEHETS